MEIVRAVYENGVLRPLRPLKLREHQTVRLQLLSDETREDDDEGEAAIRILVAAGLMRPPERGYPTSRPRIRGRAARAGRAVGPSAWQAPFEDYHRRPG